MAIFRVEKSQNYTVMSNHHLRNKNLSLKAKGLLSMMLSFPDDWNYSINGLAAVCKEEATAIRSAISELEKNHYILREQYHDKKGKFETLYRIFETPDEYDKFIENHPHIENLHTDNPHTETEDNKYTNKSNTNNKDKNDKISKNETHSSLTLELLNLGYLGDEDYLDIYDDLFETFLNKGEKFNRLRAEINYIVPRVISNHFTDENGKPIINKYGYLRSSIESNFDKMDKAREYAENDSLFDDILDLDFR